MSIDAISFIREHGVVLESAKGPVPNLADAVAKTILAIGHPTVERWREDCVVEVQPSSLSSSSQKWPCGKNRSFSE